MNTFTHLNLTSALILRVGQNFKRLSFALFFLLSSVATFAYDFTVDGFYYNVVSLDKLTCSVTSGDERYTGDVNIPESVTYKGRTFTVTSIGSSAFSGCSGLTSLSIPNSVTSIGSSAFYGCSGLTSLNIPNSVTSIGNYAFYGCSGLKELVIQDSESTLNLGYNSATAGVGEGLFYDCPLENLYLGRILGYDKSSTYGYSPFCKITTLTSVTIGNSVTSIGKYAFYGCSGLTSLSIPNSVTSIGSSAFYGCSGLTSLNIPNSVTSIGNYAFYGCSGLKELVIQDGESTLELGYNYYNYTGGGMGKGLFYDCPLENLYLGRTLEYESTFSYGYSPFYKITTLTSVTIGNTVTSIGSSAFRGCSSLTTINSQNQTPPSGVENAGFTNVQYMNVSVNVPVGSLTVYQAAKGWKNFWEMHESDFTGISTIEATDNKALRIFDLNGCKLNAPKHGLNIINGRKVLVK